MKSVLVTGACGFIGRHVAREFSEKGYDVIGLGWGKFSDSESWGLSRWYEAQVSLETLSEFAGKPDVIVHCAGSSSVGNSIEHPRHDFCLTVDTTSHVLEFVRLNSPETKVVYPSSAAAYGQVMEVPIVESAQLNPVSPYGVHKVMAESLCEMYTHRYGLNISVVRLFSIYGKGLRKQLLWDACNKFSRGDTEFFGTGKEVRDWLHVSDVAELLYIASQHAGASPIVNGGAGLGVCVEDILQLVGKHFSGGISPVFSSAPKEGDPDAYVADITRVSAWNWSPSIHWRDGIHEYVDWYKTCN